ncbi:MAG: hypothetical protein ACI4FX_09510 [Agathobacter sp.]
MTGIKPIRGGIHKFFITIVLLMIIVFFVAGTRWKNRQRDPLVFRDSLEQEAVTVNGQPLTLRDLAFYVAYEEAQVEPRALVYDSEHPTRYWNANMGGTYVRVAARDAAMQMAIHDEIFYEMAVGEGIRLRSEEEKYLAQAKDDFWSDLSEHGGDKRMGISEKDILSTMRKITYAQKYQQIYAELHNDSYEEYDFTGEAYQKLLKKQEYKIHDEVWKRVSFGSVSLNHD